MPKMIKLGASQLHRDNTLDGLKFILICLVTIGHSIEPTRYENSYSGMLYTIIYLFHMPLFILLSGYFSKKQDLEKINRQALKLLETYLVMTISIGLLLAREPLDIILMPSPSCWYLLSLIAWRYMLYYLIKKLNVNSKTLLVISVAIGALFLFLPFSSKYLGVLSVMRTTQYFSFFVLGYCLNADFIARLRKNGIKKIVVWGIALSFFCLCCIFSSREFHILEFHRDTLFGLSTIFNWAYYKSFVYLLVVSIMALIVCFACLSIKTLPRFLSNYGRYSLVFYFTQGLLTFKLAEILPNNLPLELLMAVGVIVVGERITKYCPWIATPVTHIMRIFGVGIKS